MFLNYAGKKYQSTEKSQYKSENYLLYVVLTVFTVIGLAVAGVSKSVLILCVTLTIFSDCIIASFKALYQAWERYTGYSIVNALPKVFISLFGLAAYFIFHELSGSVVIAAYMVISWAIALYFMVEFAHFTNGVKASKVFSEKNKDTTINGFLITLGNYVNLLYHSIDKQFVSILYGTVTFAQYSFAMSTQTIMTMFITSLANPFYPRLAKGDIDKPYIQRLKKLLFIFGAYSGCAYFAVSFCVKNWIVNYIPSLDVVAMFFGVFPAMAVINVIYINMYKIKKMMKKYIFTLAGMLGLAVLLNCIAALLHGDYVSISLATMISYYVWLLYSQKDFEEIELEFRDYGYLVGFLVIYFAAQIIGHEIIGFFVYGILITFWNLLIYRETVIDVLDMVKKKMRRRFAK
ncbi:hypothetical protein AALB39_25140 [Lachnospiraceae bacterium 54-53]